MTSSVQITPEARDQLVRLLTDRGVDAARLFIMDPGTPRAETCLSYCKLGEQKAEDTEWRDGDLTLFLDGPSLPYLKNARIGLQGNQITLRAPNAKKPNSVEGREVTFQRECPGHLVPSGDELPIPPGAEAVITQALGGSFTLMYHGNMVRIDGADADAIGLTSNTPKYEPPEDGSISEEQLWTALSMVYDPEIPVNIVSLGLVYEMSVDQAEGLVRVHMTLTAPACGMGDVLVDDVKRRLMQVPNVKATDVRLVFDPPWNRQMMSEEAQLETGLFF